jgi:pilus assembly protein CpaC
VFTKSSDEEGKVLLLGTIKSDKDREKINAALGILKDKTVDLLEIKEEESAVDIDVQVLELDKDATVTLGLSWPGSLNLIEKGSPGISSAGTKFSSLFKVVNLQRGTASATDPFSFTLNALVQEGKARILSRPRLACQSGKEAELLVGGEKPILTTTVAGTTGGEGTNVQYKEYGIKLNIKPTVMEENRIKLALKVEVSEVETAVTLGNPDQPTARAYPLTKRTASTELFVNDNQTIAIGGLIKQKNEEDMRKTPFLGDIPVLGVLFRKKTTTIGGGEGERGNKELFITLTPQIVGAEREPKITAISSGAPLDALTAYKELIRKRILENISYPPLAREIGLKGTVKLSLHLSFNGQLLEAKVKESSGYKLLDDEAINAAEVIGFYPPFPSSIDLEELWLDIPIVYKLN